MASWKKIIVSGSQAELAGITGSLLTNDRILQAKNDGAVHSVDGISVNSTGHLDGNFSGSFSGSFQGEVLGTIDSSSVSILAQTASVAERANELAPTATASFADRATSASIADELSQLATASFADRATSASIADELSQLATASFADVAGTARNADSASVAARATTLSPEATASIADRATTASFAETGDGLFSGSFSGSFEGDGSGLTGLATNLTVDGDTGTEDVDLLADDLQILGTSEEIETAVTKVGNDVRVTLGLPDSITVTASLATNAESASVAARATTLSSDATASIADRATSASIADEISQLATASFALNAESASVAARATTLSPEATASIADRATSASIADELSQLATASFADLAGTVHDGNITEAKIANNAVTTDKILNGNVTNAKLANDSVTIGATEIDLGTTATSIAGLDSISATTGSFVLQIFESSSTIITSGSNIFGDTQLDIQQFTGSILQTGSMQVTGSIHSEKFSGSFSGSFEGDGSGLTGLATNLTVDGDTGTEDVDLLQDDLQILGTANEIETAITKVGNDVRATIGLPDSITVTASLATNAESASVAARATELSADATASFADLASDARTADSASVAARATTLSADATASFADRATSASIADELSQLATASIADRATSASIADELSQLATASIADRATSASIADELNQLATASFADLASDARTADSAGTAISATSASAIVAGAAFPTTNGLEGQGLALDSNGDFVFGDFFGTGSTKKLDQSVAASTWSFNHSLDELYPIIQVYDGNGDQLIPERVESVDANNARLYFAEDTTGIAAAMVGGMGVSASYAITASHALNVPDTASHALTSVTASIADELSGLATASIADRATSASIADELSQLATASQADDATTASFAETGDGIFSGSFSGSFFGDGSGLTGVAGDFNFDGDSGATTINLLTETASFNGTAGEIVTAVTANTLTIGLPDDVTIGNNLTVTNDATIAGDLVVGGSIVSASSLAVEDQFIILASGSNGAIDGGIIVNQIDDDPDGKGKAFAYDSSANRWALESNLNDTASAITPDAFMGVIQEGTATPVGGADPIYGGTNGNGTIFVDTNNNEAYIYI